MTGQQGLVLPPPVRCALIQATCPLEFNRPVSEHYAYMMQKAEAQITEAACGGARIVCLEELCTGPYFCGVNDPRWKELAETVEGGPTFKLMSRLAHKHTLVLIVPIYEITPRDNQLFNTAMVIGRDGKLIGKYRKSHIPNADGFLEEYYFRAGDTGYRVFDSGLGVNLGVYICHDRRYSPGWDKLARPQKDEEGRIIRPGADIIFVPSAISPLAEKAWDRLHLVMGEQHNVFVGGLNRPGCQHPARRFYGHSYFADPTGEQISKHGSNDADDIVYADIDVRKKLEVETLWRFEAHRSPFDDR